MIIKEKVGVKGLEKTQWRKILSGLSGGPTQSHFSVKRVPQNIFLNLGCCMRLQNIPKESSDLETLVKKYEWQIYLKIIFFLKRLQKTKQSTNFYWSEQHAVLSTDGGVKAVSQSWLFPVYFAQQIIIYPALNFELLPL